MSSAIYINLKSHFLVIYKQVYAINDHLHIGIIFVILR